MSGFNLPNWRTLSSEEIGGEQFVYVEYTAPPAYCPHCGRSGEYVRFGRRQQRFRDLPIDGKPVSIMVQRQRYRCRSCGKTFLEVLPDMDDHHRATRRLIAYILGESSIRTLVSIAVDVGLSEGSIRNILRAQLNLAAEVGGRQGNRHNL